VAKRAPDLYIIIIYLFIYFIFILFIFLTNVKTILSISNGKCYSFVH